MPFDDSGRSGLAQFRGRFSDRTRGECSVIVGRIDVQSDEGVADGYISNVLLMSVLHIAGGSGGRRLEESLNQLASCEIGVAVPAGEFGHNGPYVWRR